MTLEWASSVVIRNEAYARLDTRVLGKAWRSAEFEFSRDAAGRWYLIDLKSEIPYPEPE